MCVFHTLQLQYFLSQCSLDASRFRSLYEIIRIYTSHKLKLTMLASSRWETIAFTMYAVLIKVVCINYHSFIYMSVLCRK